MFFFTEHENEIIGIILDGNDGRRGLIYHWMVKVEHRKKGFGNKLLKKVEEGLIKDDIKRNYLVVFKDNENGNDF